MNHLNNLKLACRETGVKATSANIFVHASFFFPSPSMKFGSTRWDSSTPPPAEIRSAVTETEDEQDIRFFKEYKKQGLNAFKHASDTVDKIYARGTWKKDGLPWGKWAELKLEMSRRTAYALVATKNPATEELKKFYEEQGQASSNSAVLHKLVDIQQTEPQQAESGVEQKLLDTKPPNLSCVPEEIREAVVEHIHDAHKPPPAPPPPRLENGKPKSQLAVWQELRDAYGRATNRLDEANRAWPDPAEYKHLRSLTHECFAAVERWHGKVR